MKNYALLIILISCALLLPSNLKAEELRKLSDLSKDELSCNITGYDCSIVSEKKYETYDKIDHLSVRDNSWGFRYFTAFSVDDFVESEYYYVINGEEFGPYYSFARSMSFNLSNNNYAFIFSEKEDNNMYVNANKEEFGPCEKISILSVSDNNYGFTCTNGGITNVHVNGVRYEHNAPFFRITKSHWGYMYQGEEGSMVVVNGDTFGPYDDIRSFTMSDEMWAFAYEKDGLFFVLANGMDPYQVPITSIQANAYDKGIFKLRGSFYSPKQCPFCFYPGYDEISLYKKTWGLRYRIDGEYTYFPRGENIRIITEYKMYNRLKGKILLNVDRGGMAYYINPRGKVAHYLAKPKDAFEVMRKVGVGISEDDYNLYKNRAPENLAGTIILRVQAAGEAYYINPSTLKMHYLGRPSDAFNVMRELGLGISGADFEKMTDLSK